MWKTSLKEPTSELQAQLEVNLKKNRREMSHDVKWIELLQNKAYCRVSVVTQQKGIHSSVQG
jgi:hypothetical protein